MEKNKVCSAPNCTKNIIAKALCPMHYKRMRVHGSLNISRPDEMHNKSFTREYNTWHGILQRCNNPNATGYKNYGGRGIAVCDRWAKSFVNFYEDMGDIPIGMSIDRIDNSLGYFPVNCRWATKSQQTTNTRLRSDNTSGYKGVVKHKKGIKRWQAKLWIEGVCKSLGYYPSAKEAHQAREDYLQKMNYQTIKNKKEK